MHVCTTREGRLLSLRLQGAGFDREDAELLVAMWEAGSTASAIRKAAIEMNYEPGSSLEAALEPLSQLTDAAGDGDGGPETGSARTTSDT